MSSSSVLRRFSLWQRRTAGAQPLGQVAIATESDGPAGQEGVVTVKLDPLPVYEDDLEDTGQAFSQSEQDKLLQFYEVRLVWMTVQLNALTVELDMLL